MNQYVGYITSEHQKPNFLAIVNGLTQPFDDIEQLSLDLNINTATGYMLDILGGWIGQSRALQVPIQLQPDNWDTDLYGGWDTGVWFNEYDALTTISLLDDADYRFLLMLKIAQNHFDGTSATAYKILNLLGVNAVVIDDQNMNCDITFVGNLSLIQQAIISQKIVNLAPFGVLVQYSQVNNNVAILDNPITALAGGWDTGEWVTFL
jgi:hypothetical protein